MVFAVFLGRWKGTHTEVPSDPDIKSPMPNWEAWHPEGCEGLLGGSSCANGTLTPWWLFCIPRKGTSFVIIT